MADWKKIARAALLSDGSIDTKEVEILKKEKLLLKDQCYAVLRKASAARS